MTQTAEAPDDFDVESSRQREVTYWVDERKGLFPLPWWKLLPLVAVIGGAAIAIMTLIMIPIYEGQVIDNAKEELIAAGIDPSPFTFDASYRDLDISGTLPAGVTVDDIRTAAERGGGQRDLDLDFVSGSANDNSAGGQDADAADGSASGDNAADGGGADDTANVTADAGDANGGDGDSADDSGATASTDVAAVVSADGVVLTGEVPDERHRALLVAAANKSGTVEVTDELVVRDLPATEPGATSRVLQLAKLLGSIPDDATGSATISDTSFTSEWTVTSDDDAAAIETAVNEAAGAFPDATGRSTDITVNTPEVDVEIDELQTEFEALAVDIRENVTFATGSDVLNETATETLDQVVDLMNLYTQPVVEISGHTDDVGNDARNLELSDLRAAAVRQYLVDAGIDGERIQSIGRGETEPIASNDTNEGRAENRRVELIALETFVS